MLHFLHILEACWQAGVLGEFMTDAQSYLLDTLGAIFSNVLHFAVYTTNTESCMPSPLWVLDMPLWVLNLARVLSNGLSTH